MLTAMSGRFVALAVIAGMLLAGCGSSGGAAPRTTRAVAATSTSSTSPVAPSPPPPGPPTVPADVPTTGPNLKYRGEKPPVMPALATQHTRSGAVAFAEFFIRTMDWGYASVSSTYMRHYFTADCKICAGLADGIDGIRRKHKRVYGNRLTIRPGSTTQIGGSYSADYGVAVTYQVTSGEITTDRGEFVEGEPSLTLSDRLFLRWFTDHWAVVAVEFLT